MHHSYKQPCAAVQEDIVDLGQVIADIDAIVRAPIQPEPIERQVAGLLRTLDRIAGIVTVTAPPPVAANDDTPVVTEIMCKKVRAPSRLRPLHDREFLRQLKALSAGPIRPEHGTGTEPMVVAKGRNLFPPPNPSTGPLANLTTCKPAPWREVSEEVEAHFAHLAIQTLGSSIAATAHLSEAVNTAAYADPAGPLIYLRRRIVKELTRAFGRPTAMIWTLEESDHVPGRPRVAHLHGELGFDATRPRDLAKTRAAIRKACGEWQGPARCRQIRFTLVRDTGWSSYITKDCRMATPRMVAFLKRLGAGPCYLPGHTGPTLTMSNDIRRIAKALHKNARQVIWQARQRPKAPEAAPMAVETAPAARATPRRSRQRPDFITVTLWLTPRILPVAGSRLGIPPATTAHRSRGPPCSTV